MAAQPERRLPSNFGARLKLYGLDAVACAQLRGLWPAMERGLAAGIARFLEAELEMPSVSAIFRQHGEVIGRLETGHLGHVLRGEFGPDYIESGHAVAQQYLAFGNKAISRTRLIAGNMVLRAVLGDLRRHHRWAGGSFVVGGGLVSAALAFDVATAMTLQQDAEWADAERRRSEVEGAIAAFEPAIGTVVAAISTASEALQVGSAAMREVATETSGRMASAAQASKEVAGSVDATAAATEELARAIAEIGGQSEDSLRLARSAAADAERSMALLDDLSGAARQIGSVVELISNVAAQTNLLALNATIEAARAGEAGRGFPVVAAEVKALASETAHATDAITRQIADIQNATQRSAEQIKAVAATVGRISASSLAIAASVEEQSAATRSISEGSRAAAQRTTDSSVDIGTVEAASVRALAAADNMVGWTERLGAGASDLERGVGEFFGRVRGTG